MPINAGQEYFAAEKKYSEAKTIEEKIRALEGMIKAAPKHKGAENLLADLRKRLAKLKKESKTSKKKSGKPKFVIRKEGSAQICLIGLPNSGKSSLLNLLTEAGAEVAEYPYTTNKPQVGMMLYNDVQLQLIEIPSTFDAESMSLLHSCDMVVIVLDVTKNIEEQKFGLIRILRENKINNKKIIFIENGKPLNIEEVKEKIWNGLNMIRIYTKSPSKPKAIPAIAMEKNSTVEDLTRRVHKDLMKRFKFAKIFNSTKFSGKKVGLDYKLQDDDVVEIHND